MLIGYKFPCFRDNKPIITGPEAIIRSNDPNCVISFIDFVGYLFYLKRIFILIILSKFLIYVHNIIYNLFILFLPVFLFYLSELNCCLPNKSK